MMTEVIFDIKQPGKHFHAVLKDKITILQGFSGTGKTVLADIVDQYYSRQNRVSPTISITCNADMQIRAIRSNVDSYDFPDDFTAKCEAIKQLISFGNIDLSKTVFIIDEDVELVLSSEFQHVMQEVPSLFVVINRDILSHLPYDCKSIKLMRYNDGYYDLVAGDDNLCFEIST